MKKIFTLFSLLMITVVAMAADLTTGVTFKGTWADTDGGYTPTEGEIKVTKTDDGLKFEEEPRIQRLRIPRLHRRLQDRRN